LISGIPFSGTAAARDFPSASVEGRRAPGFQLWR
jgi:hypothetical protein